MRKHFSILLFLCLPFLLCTCGRETRSSTDILRAICAKEAALPNGRIYAAKATDGEVQADETLIAALYGEEALSSALSLCESYALFLPSVPHPCEFGVFFCQSADGADTVARMCMRRREELIVAWRGHEWETYPINATVRICRMEGKYVVLFLAGADADAAYRAARGYG